MSENLFDTEELVSTLTLNIDQNLDANVIRALQTILDSFSAMRNRLKEVEFERDTLLKQIEELKNYR